MITIKGKLIEGKLHPESVAKEHIAMICDGTNFYYKENKDDSVFDSKKAEILLLTNKDEVETNKVDLSNIDIDSLTDDQVGKLKARFGL